MNVPTGYDYVVSIGRQGDTAAPRGDLLECLCLEDGNLPIFECVHTKANQALSNAYRWAAAREHKNSYANACKVYIEAFELNREYEPTNPLRADITQLLYIVANLQYWRGDEAKEGKAALKQYIQEAQIKAYN